jgi:hypothetical protein
MNDGLDGDKRGDANGQKYFAIETRYFAQVRGHGCEQVEGVSLVDSALALPFVRRAVVTPFFGYPIKHESRRIINSGKSGQFLTVWHRLGALASRPGFVVEHPQRRII